MTQDPAQVLQDFIEGVWNAHRIDRFADHVHRDVRFHPPRGPSRDFAGYRSMAEDFLRAFPDLHFAIERSGGAGDLAWARLQITGTNTGPFRGFAPSGKSVRVVGHPLCRVAEGKVIEFWQLFDEIGMVHQLGHLPDARLVGAPPPPMTRPETP